MRNMDITCFRIDNKYLAFGIAYITQERFYKHTDKDTGKEYYTFEKNDKVIKAQRILKEAKYNL